MTFNCSLTFNSGETWSVEWTAATMQATTENTVTWKVPVDLFLTHVGPAPEEVTIDKLNKALNWLRPETSPDSRAKFATILGRVESHDGDSIIPNGSTLKVRTPRRIHLCCDGTWEDPSSHSNVWNLYSALKGHDCHSEWDQVGPADQDLKAYLIGLGDDWEKKGCFLSKLDKIFGGAMGIGIRAHLEWTYKWLCMNYKPGDHLMIYGFSRGAYTARTLTGMIGEVGLAQPNDKDIQDAIKVFFDHHANNKPNGRVTALSPITSGSSRVVPVEFMGVFDTVGAVGIAFRKLRNWTAPRWAAEELGSHVRFARQALAMDERRAPFQCDRWVAVPETDSKQVWFAGDHSDIGGGHDLKDKPYLNRALSFVSMGWMLRELSHATAVQDAPSAVLATSGKVLDALNDQVLHKSAFEHANADPMNENEVVHALLAEVASVGLEGMEVDWSNPAAAVTPEAMAADQATHVNIRTQGVKHDSKFWPPHWGGMPDQYFRSISSPLDGEHWECKIWYTFKMPPPISQFRTCNKSANYGQDMFLSGQALRRVLTEPGYNSWLLMGDKTFAGLQPAAKALPGKRGRLFVIPKDGYPEGSSKWCRFPPRRYGRGKWA